MWHALDMPKSSNIFTSLIDIKEPSSVVQQKCSWIWAQNEQMYSKGTLFLRTGAQCQFFLMCFFQHFSHHPHFFLHRREDHMVRVNHTLGHLRIIRHLHEIQPGTITANHQTALLFLFLKVYFRQEIRFSLLLSSITEILKSPDPLLFHMNCRYLWKVLDQSI